MPKCPCHSGQDYSECCEPFHKGSLPKTALQLMRSRYAAYALSLPEYIIKTTHNSNPSYTIDFEKWSQEILRFSQSTQFKSLEIKEFLDGEKKAFVTFEAFLKQGGQNINFNEKSIFEKDSKGQWLYLNEEVQKK